jgi:hypothetical protein
MILLKDILSEVISSHAELKPAKEFPKEIIMECFVEVFPEYKNDVDYVLQESNFDKSWVLVDNNKVVGFYLIGDRQVLDVVDSYQLTPLEDLRKFDNKRGIEGVALGILKEYRNQNLSKLLKNKVKTSSNADYIFGLQYKSLKNLNDWVKIRRLVAKSANFYCTLEEYK